MMTKAVRMNFLNPVFQVGWQVTVRRGYKWYGLVQPGDHLLLARTGDPLPNHGIAEVLGVACIPFVILPDSFLNRVHDPECRSMAGLKRVMDAAYPESDCSDMVTVVIFKLI